MDIMSIIHCLNIKDIRVYQILKRVPIKHLMIFQTYNRMIKNGKKHIFHLKKRNHKTFTIHASFLRILIIEQHWN